MKTSEKVYLIILDGFGMSSQKEGNAFAQAKAPFLKELFSQHTSFLKAHGEVVGLPPFQTGGSEVGHLTIGAGRAIKHILTRISEEISSGDFFEKPALRKLFQQAKAQNRIHFVGLLSDGGIHSYWPHMKSLAQMAKDYGIEHIYLHAFLDGRDVPPRSAEMYLSAVEEETPVRLASMGGRFYGMDRDQNWDRIQRAYEVIVDPEAPTSQEDWRAYLVRYYKERDMSDYYVPPVCFDKEGQIREEDIVICFNFRTDRMRQIMQAFCDTDFPHFSRKKLLNPKHFGIFGNYHPEAVILFSLSREPITQTLGEVVASYGWKQLRVAETEKFNHVTYFFSGERKEPFPGEERILVPSPKCASYAEKPEMSAYEHTKEALAKVAAEDFALVVHNYANGDLVGHSADLAAAIRAVEVMDDCLKELIPKVHAQGYHVIVTADHGNCETMTYEDGKPNPSHSKNPVPCRIYPASSVSLQVRDAGDLRDIAPTICQMLKIPTPSVMTGKSLLRS